MDSDSKRSAFSMILVGLCVGYVAVYFAWLALAGAGVSWESFFPSPYGPRIVYTRSYIQPQIVVGFVSALSALALFALAFGVALGRQWARLTSIVLSVLILCFSVFMFWDGYLRIKPRYSGEEGSEVFGALVFSLTSLCVLVAMFVPAAKRYFDRTSGSFDLRPRARRV